MADDQAPATSTEQRGGGYPGQDSAGTQAASVRRVNERQPVFTLLVVATRHPCTVIFEPVGTTYALAPDDEVVIHFYDRVGRPDLKDVEVEYRTDAVVVHTLCEHRAWHKAGDELPV